MLIRTTVLGITALALCVAVGLNLQPKAQDHSYLGTHPLTLLVPKTPSHWEVRDTALGATELEVGETIRTLKLTSYFYKTYTDGGLIVRVYVAYWAPGRVDPRQVWYHQPDNCWVANGASIAGGENDLRLKGPDNEVLRPAIFRRFHFPTGVEEVLFWHLVGGKNSGFGTQAPFLPLVWAERFVHSLYLNGGGLAPKEQIVVRISTNREIADVEQSVLWPQFRSLFLLSGVAERHGDQP